MLAKVEGINSICLICCALVSEITNLLRNQRLTNIHIIGDSHIDNTSVTKEAVDVIAYSILNSSKLQTIDLSGTNLKSAGMIKIAEALMYTSSLTELRIQKNNIVTEAANDIAAAILSNNKLQVLDLGENSLKTAGMIHIARALQEISSLYQLNINRNNITDEAADDIAAAILSNNKFQKLDLSGNEFKATGMINIAGALQGISSLTELNVGFNCITDEVADDLLSILQRNINLRRLDLSNNKLQAAGAIKIVKSIQNIYMSSFLMLFFENNQISKEARDEITAILSSNKSVDCKV